MRLITLLLTLSITTTGSNFFVSARPHSNGKFSDSQKQDVIEEDKSHDNNNSKKLGFNDDVEFDDRIQNEKQHPEQANNICNNLYKFPITTLNLTEFNCVSVAHFKRDNASLEFWLNYTFTSNLELDEHLRIGTRRGLSHVSIEHVKGEDIGQGGFKVKMWDTFDLVNRTANWAISVRQKNCSQPPVDIQIITTNPLNLTPTIIQYDDRLSSQNCTAESTIVKPFYVSSVLGDEITFHLNHTDQENLDVQVAQVRCELEDNKQPKGKNQKHEGHIDCPRNGTWTARFKSIPGIPANVSIYSENRNGSTRVHVRISDGQRNTSGNLCAALAIQDGISGNENLKNFSLSHDRDVHF